MLKINVKIQYLLKGVKDSFQESQEFSSDYK